MNIGLIETGRGTSELQARHGRFTEWFRDLLSTQDGNLTFTDYAAVDGQIPSRPGECAAYVITGSPHSVYEDLPWRAPLQDFLREVSSLGQRIVGICFGHQLLADTFGGEVRRATQGWGIGVHRYDVHAPMPWMDEDITGFDSLVSHQDQVVSPPPGARVIAGSSFCPNGVLQINDNVLSFQNHPEMPFEVSSDLMDLRRDIIEPQVLAAGRASLARPVDREMMARWMVRFLRGDHLEERKDQAPGSARAISSSAT